MLVLKKQLVPLYAGKAKKGYIHVAIVDENGYEKLIDEVDKKDAVSNSIEVWPEFETFAGLAYHRQHLKGGTSDWWVILPVKKPNDKIDVDTVAHEALHISRMILDSRGVHFDPNNDEPYAYMVGKVTAQAEKNCGCIIVDGKPILGARGFTEQPSDMHMSLPPSALIKIVLEV